jgi:hypothetical protein
MRQGTRQTPTTSERRYDAADLRLQKARDAVRAAQSELVAAEREYAEALRVWRDEE